MMDHRLRGARAQLVLQHPFLGALLLRLLMRPDERCRSIATDGAEIHYHAAFLKDLSLGDIQLRKLRTVGRSRMVFALSPIVWLAVLVTMAPKIVSESETQDDQRSSDGSANDDIAERWQSNVTHLAQPLRSKRRLSPSLQRALDATLQPVLPWQALLARFLASHDRDDYSFHRISRRGGDALLPSLHSQQTNLIIAIDNSGSISDGEINEFIAEIDALKSQVRAHVTLLA